MVSDRVAMAAGGVMAAEQKGVCPNAIVVAYSTLSRSRWYYPKMNETSILYIIPV
jgi:hypothetical protein